MEKTSFKELHILIKPASSSCNLNCTYCFYHDVAKHREVESRGMMSRATLSKIVEQAFAEIGEGHVTFSFQGGEPMLAGMEFYRHFIELINLNSSPSVKVSINIQTNGTLMTSAWASFFHDNGFLVGVSVDGNREIHDKYRLARDGSKSYDKVIKAIEILREHKVEFNVLTVVHDELTEHVNEIYEAYRQQLFENLQFIPCLEPLGSEPDQKPWLDPRKYGQFLIELFDLWYADLMQGQYRSIRYFDNVIRMASNEEPPSCEMKGRCSIQFVVEADGSVYPCDYYALDAYLLGNINVDSFAGMYGSKAAKDFLLESYHDHDDCRVCPYYQLCRGGCKRHQQNEAHGPIGLNRFCLAYIMFFDARIKEIEKIAAFYIQSKQDYEK